MCVQETTEIIIKKNVKDFAYCSASPMFYIKVTFKNKYQGPAYKEMPLCHFYCVSMKKICAMTEYCTEKNALLASVFGLLFSYQNI